MMWRYSNHFCELSIEICLRLRDRDEQVREGVRKTLLFVVKKFGSKHLQSLLEVLKSSLYAGYMTNILGHVLVDVLEEISESSSPDEISPSIDTIMEVKFPFPSFLPLFLPLFLSPSLSVCLFVCFSFFHFLSSEKFSAVSLRYRDSLRKEFFLYFVFSFVLLFLAYSSLIIIITLTIIIIIMIIHVDATE